MKPIETVIDKLDRVQRSAGGFVARCPAHEDKVASLSVSEGNDEKVVMHCHAGCHIDDIVKAMGLTMVDLFPIKEQKFYKIEDAQAAYDYHDESGNLLYRVGRYPGKEFRQFGPTGKAGVKGIRRVPYRLPQLIDAVRSNRWVFVVEGEKDVATLEANGFVATCNSAGAGKWDENWCVYFDQANVAIIPDNDDPGREHAALVERSLEGVARKVKVIDLGSDRKGYDISDWFADGHDAAELRTLVAAEPPLDLVTVRVADVERQPVHWLWHGWLPLGKLSILEGDPGLGKSTVTLDLAARLTTGSPLPDEQRPVAISNVLVFTSEDAVADTIRPRLEAAGADLTRVHVVKGIKSGDEQRFIQLPDDIIAIEEAIKAHDIRFVIVDPLVAFLGADTDSHRDQDIRRALYPLSDLAERMGVAILLMRHLSKGQGKAIYRGGGSIGLGGAVRLVMMVTTDPDDADRQVLVVHKSNLAKKPAGYYYRIKSNEEFDVGQIAWLHECPLTVDELLAPPKRKSDRLMEEV